MKTAGGDPTVHNGGKPNGVEDKGGEASGGTVGLEEEDPAEMIPNPITNPNPNPPHPIRVVFCASSLYDYAKENAEPLQPGVQALEGIVSSVVGPVVDKFHDIPLELPGFVDHKA